MADPYGRVLNYVDTFDGTYSQDLQVPLNRAATLYPEVRDAFGWAAVLGLAALLVATWFRRRRLRLAAPEPEPAPLPERPLAPTGA